MSTKSAPGGAVRSSKAAHLGPEVDRWLKQMEHEQIAKRAHELFIARGSVPGRDLENWLEAEREVKRQLAEAEMADEPEILIKARRAKNGQIRVQSVSFRTLRKSSARKCANSGNN